MKLTRKWVLAIVGDKWPLQHRHVLGRAVRIRSPYVDASLTQVLALKSLRKKVDKEELSHGKRGRATPTSSCAPSRVSRQACRTRADRSADCLDEASREAPCRSAARASPLALSGLRLAGGGARRGGADRTTDSDDRRGHMDAERDTDGTTDAYEVSFVK